MYKSVTKIDFLCQTFSTRWGSNRQARSQGGNGGYAPPPIPNVAPKCFR